MVTWKASGSYVPSFYEGKALPTYGSKITANLELVSPQGKILDLSSQVIYWYLNETLVGGGIGVQSVSFPPFGEPPTSLTLKIVVPNFNGNYLVHQIIIPMVNPAAVIYSPYPGGQFSENPLTVEALPYFFNTTDVNNLVFTWSANGQGGNNAENPQNAQITLPASTPSGSSLDISLSIQNPNDSTSASDEKLLTYQSTL